MVNVRSASVLIMMVTAACATGSAPPAVAPKASRAALDAKPVLWNSRDPSVPVVPTSIKHLQVVITGGWSKDEHYAWLISDGTDVIRLYRCSGTEISDIVEAAVRTVYPTKGTPLDAMSIGVLGAIHNPGPPPPPDPGGVPELYVQQVMKAAWGMNQEQVQAEGKATGPTGP